MKEDPTFEHAWENICAESRKESRHRIENDLREAAAKHGYHICGYVKLQDLRSKKFYYVWGEGERRRK